MKPAADTGTLKVPKTRLCELWDGQKKIKILKISALADQSSRRKMGERHEWKTSSLRLRRKRPETVENR